MCIRDREFTPARDALVKDHKADKDLAAALKKLKKPSLAAWVVNLLVRRDAASDGFLSFFSAAARSLSALWSLTSASRAGVNSGGVRP